MKFVNKNPDNNTFNLKAQGVKNLLSKVLKELIMIYKWDNKKPTAQMLGRWQPFHEGHYTLFKEI
tara:strand:+ start:162 stop:356 length:195 start_codon:yes stop_codon:yes gene_type:complete